MKVLIHRLRLNLRRCSCPASSRQEPDDHLVSTSQWTPWTQR